MADVRKRTAETVRPLSETTGEEQPAALQPSSFPKEAEKERERAAAIKALIDKGTKLFETSKKSGFQEIAKLSQGVKFLAAAAGKGSDEAIERLQTLFLSGPKESFSSVMEKLPHELVSVMKVMVEGSEAEKQIYQIASDIFSTVAAGENFILKDEIDSAAERLLNSEIEAGGKESSKSAWRMKKAVRRLLRCSVNTDDEGKEVVCCVSLLALWPSR